jgi:class 3 adenylate cyclase/tetratricopeptide (TPR) repeat protein
VGKSATVTVLFTDIVDSTARLQELGELRAHAVFDAHHELLSSTLAEHGGDEVKWLGDGVMAVFSSAADAVRCAIELQRRAAAVTPVARVAIRAGLALGEATREDDGDWFGTPVVTAARLCAAAGAGEILCPELVAGLLGGFEDLAFVELGPRELKGLGSSVVVSSVRYEATPVVPARAPVVGRDADLRALREQLDGAESGSFGLVLVSGEPGVGKTRLVEELADDATARGFAVGWGSCHEDAGAPTLWPWLRALRELAVACPTDLSALGHRWPVVAHALPELVTRVQPEPPPALDPAAARFRLLDSMDALLGVVTSSRPALVVLDDLHWADATSLDLLTLVAAGVGDRPLLVVGTYRDVEVGRGHPLAAALAELARRPRVTRHVLRGISAGAVTELVGALGLPDVAHVADNVFERTDGNPFFVTELVRLIQGGAVDRVPEGVRDVVGRRVDRLSSDAGEVLAAGAVLGRDVHVSLLSACVDLDQAAVIDAVDEALAAGLLTERGVRPGHVRFVHALIREVLLDELSSLRRIGLHRRIVAALRASDSRPGTATELAHHLLEAAPAGDVGAAVDAAMAAADGALARYGYAEAEDWYERALQALELAPDPEDARSAELLLRRGDVRHRAGRLEEAGADLHRAAAAAERAGRADLLARAALGVAGAPEETSASQTGDIELLDRALGVVDAVEDAQRAMLLARQAILLVDRGDPLGQDLLAQALDLAARSGDPGAQIYVRRVRHRLWFDPLALEERLAGADELVELGRSRRDLETETWGHRWRLIALFETEDVEAVDRELDELQRLADELRQPFHEWGWVVRRAGRALMEGRLAEADELTIRALTLAAGMGTEFTLMSSMNQLFHVRAVQGRVGELVAGVEASAAALPLLTPVAAFARLELGDLDEARARIAGFEPRILTEGSRLLYSTGAALLAELAVGLGDAELGHAARALLEPLTGRMAVITPGLSVLAPIDHALALASHAVGDLAAAETFLRQAIDQLRRMGAEGLLPRTQVALARVLSDLDDPAAGALLDEAMTRARRLGLGGALALADRPRR